MLSPVGCGCQNPMLSGEKQGQQIKARKRNLCKSVQNTSQCMFMHIHEQNLKLNVHQCKAMRINANQHKPMQTNWNWPCSAMLS